MVKTFNTNWFLWSLVEVRLDIFNVAAILIFILVILYFLVIFFVIFLLLLLLLFLIRLAVILENFGDIKYVFCSFLNTKK